MSVRPLIIGHRGNAGEAPENTRVSFQQALDLGVDLIELDVNRTRDGHPVIVHGPELDRLAGVPASIHDLPLEEARKLDFGAAKGFHGERLLSFPEALDFARGRIGLAVDLKTFDILPEIVRCIRDAGMLDSVVLCGCDASAARQVRACEPRLAVGLNMDDRMKALARQDDPAEFHHEYVREAAHHQLSPLNVNHRHVTPELLRLARLRAIAVWAWTVDDPEDARRLAALGVDALYTNFPRRLLELFGS